MEANLLELRGAMRSLRRGSVVVSRRAAFSSLRAGLVAKKEASCC